MVRTVACLVALALAACSSSPTRVGSEGGPCTPEGTCNEGLLCLGSLCVAPRDSGWLDAFKPLPDLVAGRDLPPGLPDRPPRDAPPGPKVDLPGPKLDLPKPKADTLSPNACKTWTQYSCIIPPRSAGGAICWATCQGRSIWCIATGYCTCTFTGSCGGGFPVNMGNPCATCKAALETKGCCVP